MCRRFVFFVVALAIGSAACGQKGRNPAAGADSSAIAPPSDDDEYFLGERVDSTTDRFLLAIAPRLGQWVQRWRSVAPGFSLDSLYRESSHFPLGYRRAADSDDLARARFFGEVSPDSTRIVEPDIYREKDEGAWELRGEPDAAPAIIDLRTDTLTVITVTGPGGGFEDAFWIDRDHVVLVANGERRFEPWAGGGDLWVIDLPRETLVYYHTPDVSKGAFDRYLKLSDAAQRKRFGIPPPL